MQYQRQLVEEVRSSIMRGYTTQNETIYMMDWLLSTCDARQRFEQGQPVARANNWRLAVTSMEREMTILRIDAVFEKFRWKASTQCAVDYSNKLQVFELALLTKANSLELYRSMEFLEQQLPVIVQAFQQFVRKCMLEVQEAEVQRRVQLVLSLARDGAS